MNLNLVENTDSNEYSYFTNISIAKLINNLDNLIYFRELPKGSS